MFNKGSCWCGEDSYCMCTPSLAIDVIVEIAPESSNNREDVSFVLVERRHPPKNQFAISGGFVDVGESVEDAAVREMHEEMNLKLRTEDLHQFHVYSDPNRDKRRHTVSVVFFTRISESQWKLMRSGDDTKGLARFKLTDLPHADAIAFDHWSILHDYIAKFYPT